MEPSVYDDDRAITADDIPWTLPFTDRLTFTETERWLADTLREAMHHVAELTTRLKRETVKLRAAHDEIRRLRVQLAMDQDHAA